LVDRQSFGSGPKVLDAPVQSGEEPLVWSSLSFMKSRRYPMSKETPKDDPRQQSDHSSHKQTGKPWKSNPEKEQRNDDAKIDLERWQLKVAV
jgi:hypothetical protein